MVKFNEKSNKFEILKKFDGFGDLEIWRKEIYSKILNNDGLKLNSQTSQLYFIDDKKENLTDYPIFTANGVVKHNDFYILISEKNVFSLSNDSLVPKIIFTFDEALPFGSMGGSVPMLSDTNNNKIYAVSIFDCIGDFQSAPCENYANLLEFDLNKSSYKLIPLDEKIADLTNLKLKKINSNIVIVDKEGNILEKVSVEESK